MRTNVGQIHISYFRDKFAAYPDIRCGLHNYKGNLRNCIWLLKNGHRQAIHLVDTKKGREMSILLNEREKCRQILRRLESEFMDKYGYLPESVEVPDYGNSNNRKLFDSLVTGWNPYKKENKVRYKDCFYRSKLEADFARIMDEHGILFKYEPEITVYNGRHRYPDFVVYLPWLDILILVEIYGRCDDPDYVKTVCDRQYDYMMSDWMPGINMLSYYYYSNSPYIPEMVMEEIETVELRNYLMMQITG